MEEIKVPVLLIGFNRPKCIKKVMERLTIVKPQKLYVSIDGARKERKGEDILVEQVKQIVKNISWNCDVRYQFHEGNVGAEVNVSSAISWVLENEEYVIVNEDDIYAPYSFYKFEQDMLFKYRDDTRIGMVSGNNFTPISDRKYKNDYLFARYGHICGWGTWKRVWKEYSLDEEIDNRYMNLSFLETVSANKRIAQQNLDFLSAMRLKGKGKNTWDYMFWYYRLKHDYLSVIPRVNLVSNIGIEGLHQQSFSLFNFLYADEKFEAMNHPPQVCWNRDYDIYHFEHHIAPSKMYQYWKGVKAFYIRKTKFNQRFFNEFFEE